MDLVCPARQETAGHHPELRYALRSFDSNVSGIDEVWILGGKPRWLRDANHIPLVQGGAKYQNVRRMLQHACLEPAISDPFLLINDDMFALLPQEMSALQMLHGGPFQEFVQNQRGRVGNSRYVQGAGQTLKLLERQGYHAPLSWSLHTPIVVHKAAFLEAIHLCGDSGVPLHLRSLYGALQGLEGTRHVDVKLVGKALPAPDWKYVSTSDASFQMQPVGKLIQSRFKASSRWEHSIS